MQRNKKLMYILIGVALSFILFSIWRTGALNAYLPFFMTTDNNNGSTDGRTSSLTEAEARAIAETSCIKDNETLFEGSYNEITKTWWFDANLDRTPDGCNPACVVDEETKTAEINWRCTGLNPPDDESCGIENCHGLDIVCGPNPAEVCTMEYRFGDKCRQFAKCGVVEGTCQLIDNPQFTTCKACVEKCEGDYKNDTDRLFTCESKCGE